jgi:glyoxylase-like metal-dependent hydrolase (beta-lactamase superfamily II)
MLFTGDVLFEHGIGRTDLPGGNMEEIERSIHRLYEFPGETVVYPGHGGTTTIAAERRGNPFVRGEE